MYCVIDLETSIYESYGRRANPFDARNYIVASGLKYQDGRKALRHKLADSSMFADNWLDGVTCLVGQNIKFDLQYLWKRSDIQQFLSRGGRIFDTMYAEYLMSGQHQRFENGQAEGLDLNTLAVKYGGTTKPDKIKEYWQAGIQTIDIDPTELLEYLDGDIENTEIVFLGQIKRYVGFGMTNCIKAHMEGLLGTIEMEVNGLVVNQETGETHRKELVQQIAECKAELDSFIPKDLPDSIQWNWGSGDHVSALFFGGTLRYDVREQKKDEDGNLLFTKAQEVVYVHKDGSSITNEQFEKLTDKDCLQVHVKGKKVGQYVTQKIDVQGNPKMHTVDAYFHVEGTTVPKPAWETKKKGVYQTGDKVKTILAAEGLAVAKTIHKLNKLQKLLGFYRYTDKAGVEKGLLTMVQSDGLIHHKLNTTTTVTGRLSSSDPNMQQCFDGETEIMTELGFIPFKEFVELTDIPKVVQFFLPQDQCVWVHPKRIIKQLYTGTMVRYVSENTDMYVTAGHRCVVRVRNKGHNSFLKAHFLNHERSYQYSHLIATKNGIVTAERVSEGEATSVEVEDFPVYCVTVHSGAIIVRRNGKTYVSGNCPRSDTGKVREMLVSRFGDDGKVAEVDFSQLEVHGQAFLSGDDNMKRDVTNKVDFHCMRVAAKLGEPYDDVKLKCKSEDHPQHKEYKKIRTGAKSFSFQRAYGASVATIAADTGMLIDDVQALADSEDKLYPAVVEYNNSNIEAVKASAANSSEYVTQFDDKTGRMIRYNVGYLVSPTGKRYSFLEQAPPEWMIERAENQNAARARRGLPAISVNRKTIAPQQVKNYPVQGFCGELMMNVVGALFREFIKHNRWNNKAFLINTVHDCIWVDCHKAVATEVVLKVKEIMEQAATILEKRYSITVDVPFYAEAEMGNNFYDMQGVH